LNGAYPTWFGNAGFNDFKNERSGFVGWMGLGGSVIQWHPEARVAVGYATNLMEGTFGNDRARVLQDEILRCAQLSKELVKERDGANSKM